MASKNAGMLGSAAFYGSSFTLPEGSYIWKDVEVKMFKGFGKDADSRSPRLGVMLTLVPKSDPQTKEPHSVFYSMGTNSHKSWAPDPDGGRGVVPLADGEGKPLPDSTNWGILFKSLGDCGLPEGVVTNDLGTIIGMHTHMSLVDPPKERSGFASTGEAQEQRKDNKIPIVSEILDDGKPWEGTGGMPKGTGKAAAPAKSTAKPAAKKVEVEVEAEEVEEADDDVMTVAASAIESVLTSNPNGLGRLKMKMGVFNSVKEKHGEEMSQKVSDTVFADEKALAKVLSDMGYKITGKGPQAQVVPE